MSLSRRGCAVRRVIQPATPRATTTTPTTRRAACLLIAFTDALAADRDTRPADARLLRTSRSGATVEELEDLRQVDARVGTHRRRRDHLRLLARQRPGQARPALAQVADRRPAARALRAHRDLTPARLTTAEELRVG